MESTMPFFTAYIISSEVFLRLNLCRIFLRWVFTVWTLINSLLAISFVVSPWDKSLMISISLLVLLTVFSSGSPVFIFKRNSVLSTQSFGQIIKLIYALLIIQVIMTVIKFLVFGFKIVNKPLSLNIRCENSLPWYIYQFHFFVFRKNRGKEMLRSQCAE